VPVKVKVCGLTQVDNALACAEAGADWIGLNFHPASPRSISVERGAEIASALVDQGKAIPIGLFVNLEFEVMRRIAHQEVGVFTVQLHGDEDVDYLKRCSSYKPCVQVVRAFRLSDRKSIEAMQAYLDEAKARWCSPHAILVDAHVSGQPGGTGQTIAMDLLDQLPPHPRLILAGGLTPENVAEAVARVRPWMVDVASGVESSPGLKDLTKVAAFVRAAKGISVDAP
jgi:phosphoribosylanthranilate isomerase